MQFIICLALTISFSWYHKRAIYS